MAGMGTVCRCPVDQLAWEESAVRQDPSHLEPNRYRGPRGPSRLQWGSMTENMAASSTEAGDVDPIWGAARETSPWKLDSDEESAQRWLDALPTEQQAWVWHLQHQQSARRCAQEVLTLRASAKLSRRGEGIKLGQDNTATQMTSVQGGRCAASAVSMCSGRHRAMFTMKHGEGLLFGVIRPSWDVETGKNPHFSDPFGPDPHGCDEHCLYLTSTGQRYPGCQDWPGMQPATLADTVTMQLDLDAGTMTVWINDQRLGVMASGLTGSYCWAISLAGRGHSATIANASPGPAPALQVQRASWGAPSDLLSLGLSAQCGKLSPQYFSDRDDLDDKEYRPPPPGCADISDRMIEQLFQEKQKRLRRQRRRQQQQQQQPTHLQKQRPTDQLRLLQVTARGWPSMGITTQQAHEADALARGLLRPGW